MLYRVIGLAFSVYKISWVRPDNLLKYIIDTTKISSIFYYYVYSLMYHYLTCDQQTTLTYVNNKMVLFYKTVFFIFKFIYLNHIKSLQSGRKFEPSISNDMLPHFSDPNLDHTFYIFWLHTWIIFLFFSYVTIVNLL